uniref:Uncharacterized protein n=1 Tax=Ascaris lumbricoides TaxID=6252 RepID=A0A0M3IH26_ASCLU
MSSIFLFSSFRCIIGDDIIFDCFEMSSYRLSGSDFLFFCTVQK